jgi:broad specificity phosphatase PhoE
MARNEIWLIRHGETPWSLSGQHTGWSDLALNEEGERQATRLKAVLAEETFDAVYCSPLQRARRTCQLAGLEANAVYLDNLREWNYGSLEGKTAIEIRQGTPDWSIWTHGTPDGESIEQVYARTAKVIETASEAEGTVALFAHGHLLRILAANYLGLPPRAASLFALSTASISVLGWEKENRVIRRWNWTLENR